MFHPILEFDRQREAARSVARRWVWLSVAAWFSGMLGIMAAAAAARNGAIESQFMLVVALAAGWMVGGVSAAAAVCIAAWNWSALPASSRLLAIAPWAAVCLVATIVLWNHLF